MGTELGLPPGILGAGMPVGGMPSSLMPTLERRGARRSGLLLAGMDAWALPLPHDAPLEALTLEAPLAALATLPMLAMLAALAALAALATDVALVDCAIGRPPMPGAGPRPNPRGPVPCDPRTTGRSPRSSTRSMRDDGRSYENMSERDGGRSERECMSERDGGRSQRDRGRMSAREERPETETEATDDVGLRICDPIDALRDGAGIRVGLIAPLRLEVLVCACDLGGGRDGPRVDDEREPMPVETESGGRPEGRADLAPGRPDTDEAVGVDPGDARWLRDRAGARGDGMPGRWGSRRAPTPRGGSSGDDGSFRCPGRAGGVSSTSESRTHAVGERRVDEALGVTVPPGGGLESAATRLCCAFAEFATGVEVDSCFRGGITLRLGMRAPRRSSVAFRRVWMSCSRRMPLVLAPWWATFDVVNVRRIGAASLVDSDRFRVVVLLERAGIAEGEGAGSVLLTLGDDRTGVVVLRGIRGDCLTVRGVTVVLWSARFVAAVTADWEDRCVVADPSVGVGDGAAECMSLSNIGDIGASEEGGVGTTARASRSRKMAISLLASVRLAKTYAAAVPTPNVVLEALAFLVQFLLLYDLLLKKCLLLDGAVVPHVHVKERRMRHATMS